MSDEIPRRVRIDKLTPVERAIYDVMLEVEKMGADERLTRAVTLLSDARSAVADYVDGQQPCRNPAA